MLISNLLHKVLGDPMKLVQNRFNQDRVDFVSFNQSEAERKLVTTVAFDLVSLLQILQLTLCYLIIKRL